MIEADHQSIIFPKQLDRTLPRLAPNFRGNACQQLSACELSMQLLARSIDELEPRFRQLALQGSNEPCELCGWQRAQDANSQRSVGDTCPEVSLHLVAGTQDLLRS